MPLSQQIQDQIRKDAEYYYDHLPKNYLPSVTEAYSEGAKAWAVWKEKAEGYEKALNIILANSMDIHIVEQTARKAIEQFK